MVSLISSKITVTKKNKELATGRKREEEKKAMCVLLVVIMALWRHFGRKKLLDGKGPFGDNVFKNPASWPRGGHCHIKAVWVWSNSAWEELKQ